MKRIEHAGLRTWIEIDTKAIRANYKTFRKLVPKNVQLMGVVKSNAYGHNLTEFAQELEKLGVDMLAVDSLVEALSLRKAGVISDILVLGYTLPEMFSKVIDKNIHLTISSMDGLRTFLKTPNASDIRIHLKVDTGMHRQGFLFSEIEDVLKILTPTNMSPIRGRDTLRALATSNGIKITGLYTHFASAKDTNDRAFTNRQIEEFKIWREALISASFFPTVHSGATGGGLLFPESHFDMVRVGIGMYGVWPSQEIELDFKNKLKLKPVLSWKTIISEVKEISAGASVGYDLTYKARQKSRIAVCPIGYWHGYPRELSNNSEVLVNGARAKVLGRVSMDMIVIDVTNVPRVKVGDEVVLIGRSGKEEITARELAVLARTTPYEILTRLNPLMKRIYR